MPKLKVISNNKVRANRENAKKSTGPRTVSGKEKVSGNALTHGLTAEKHVIIGESIEEFLPRHTAGLQSALEIGPGYGQFLKALSSVFDKVTALDNSEEMLEQSIARASTQGLQNIAFVVGDTQQALNQGTKYDLVSLNMVLHHNPTPAEIISDCAQLLAKSGVLIITDLCAHDQEWARESCGDIWLGFEPEALTRWCESVGLKEGSSLYLTQRNGFRIQLRQFSLGKS